MKRTTSALFSLLFVPSILLAQTAPPKSEKNFTIQPWAVGQSAAYQIETLDAKGQVLNSETITYSIVSQEEVKGKKYFWVEVETQKPGVTIVKKLQVRQPRAIDFENAMSDPGEVLKPRRRMQKIILADAGNRVSSCEFEVPAESVSLVENGPDPSATRDLTSQYLVTSGVDVSVPAGHFTATQLHHLPLLDGSESIDDWGSALVPIWGEVKRVRKSQDGSGNAVIRQTQLISYSENGADSKFKPNEAPRFLGLDQQRKSSGEIPGEDPGNFGNQGMNEK